MTIRQQISKLLAHESYMRSKMRLAVDLNISTKTIDRILAGYTKIRPLIQEKIQSVYDKHFNGTN